MPTMPTTSPIIVPAPGTAAPSPIVPVIPQQADPTYDTVAIDSSYNPRGSLLTYVDGSNWTVEYYRQLLGASNELSPQQVDRPGPYQQYELIHNLLLKVTSPLSTTQDSKSKSMVLTGEATVLHGLIPNVGNEFVADSGDGRAAIFLVTSSEKKSLLLDSVYVIEYVLKDYATTEYINDLNAKVVQEASFVAGNMMVGQNPIIATADLTILQQLKSQYQLLVSQYFSTFFSVEYQTLLVPNQLDATYDTFLVHAILNWITTEEHPYVPKVRAWNVTGDQALTMKTLWDAFNVMRADFLPLVCHRMGLTGVRVANHYPYFQSVFYSGMSQLVYPIDTRTDVDEQYVSYAPPAMSALGEGRPVLKDISRLISNAPLDGFSYNTVGDATLPDIIPVTVDDYYVFSQGFYQPQPKPASALEQLALNALSGRALDLGQLLRLATNASVWGNVERFYYVPVLFALIKTQIGAI